MDMLQMSLWDAPTRSFPTGQVHPFKFKSPVWGVNRFVSSWLRFLLPWPVSRDGSGFCCVWAHGSSINVQHRCCHNCSGNPAHVPKGMGCPPPGGPGSWDSRLLPFQTRPRQMAESPAMETELLPGTHTAPPWAPCSTPVMESPMQPGAPPTSRRLPVWWPCASTCRPCHTQGAQITPSHCPPTLCNEVLPPALPALPGTSTLPRGPHVRPGRGTRRDRARAGRSCGRAALTRWCPPAVTVPLPHLPSLSSLIRALSPPTQQPPAFPPSSQGFSAGHPRGLQTGVGVGRLVRKGMGASGRPWGSVGRS